MNEYGAAPGLMLLCCVVIWPFVTGLLIGWFVRGHVLAHGWLGLLPKFIRDHIIFEE